MGFFVYIMTNARNGTLYVGHTDDLARRVAQHRSGATPGFTKRYGLTRLVHAERFETREEARLRERALKSWRRAWKLALIEKDNPQWRDLAHDL